MFPVFRALMRNISFKVTFLTILLASGVYTCLEFCGFSSHEDVSVGQLERPQLQASSRLKFLINFRIKNAAAITTMMITTMVCMASSP
jgi:hypothetical protein